MTYNLNELENKYHVKLDDTQLSVLSSLIDFIYNDKKNRITLCSHAGCGKTLIVKILYQILAENGYYTCCITPTNKAKSLFDSDINTCTIHSLLKLQPNLNILDFDAKDLQFDLFNKDKNNIQKYDVLIVDECSMINSKLYSLLIQIFNKTKIIFCGDPKQLACIEDGKISETFNNDKLYLNKVYRQSDDIIQKVITHLREKPIYNFRTTIGDSNSILVYNNLNTILNKYYYLFKLSEDFQSVNLTKFITFSNNRINALNSIIRKKLYNDNNEYHSREILTAYDTLRVDNTIILENSVDYFIESYKPCYIHNIYPGYQLTVTDQNNTTIVFEILSRNIPEYLLNQLAETLESLRLESCKRKSFAKYYDYNYFATPIDIVYNNRIIKRKTIDYGYCISAYKSQGSNYQIVLIDMENFYYYTKGEKLRQLQYVACSRSTNDIIIYQK